MAHTYSTYAYTHMYMIGGKEGLSIYKVEHWKSPKKNWGSAGITLHINREPHALYMHVHSYKYMQ